MPGIGARSVYLAFVLFFPVLMLLILKSDHAGEVCARVMSGADERLRYWYEIPCSRDFQTPGNLVTGVIGAFVLTGMYASIVFTTAAWTIGALANRFVPNRARLIEWITTLTLVTFPAAVLLIAFR